MSIRGNGRWLFQARPGERRVPRERSTTTAAWPEGRGRQRPASSIRPKTGSRASSCFKVYAANVDHVDADRGRRACGPPAATCCGSRSRATPACTASRSGKPEGAGRKPAKLALLDEVAGVTQCLVKIEMPAGAPARRRSGLLDHDDDHATQPPQRCPSYAGPQPGRAPGRPAGRIGRDLAAAARRASTASWPPRRRIDTSSDKQPDAGYKATLGAGVDGKECSVDLAAGRAHAILPP